MTHPLTDEIISENFIPDYDYFDDLSGEICLGFDNDDLRAAADWQLERDVDFFRKFLVVSLGIYPLTAELMAQDFKKVMRPQQ